MHCDEILLVLYRRQFHHLQRCLCAMRVTHCDPNQPASNECIFSWSQYSKETKALDANTQHSLEDHEHILQIKNLMAVTNLLAAENHKQYPFMLMKTCELKNIPSMCIIWCIQKADVHQALKQHKALSISGASVIFKIMGSVNLSKVTMIQWTQSSEEFSFNDKPACRN